MHGALGELFDEIRWAGGGEPASIMKLFATTEQTGSVSYPISADK